MIIGYYSIFNTIRHSNQNVNMNMLFFLPNSIYLLTDINNSYEIINFLVFSPIHG
jgi:hypothetical protein